jgi:hypothetical protein
MPVHLWYENNVITRKQVARRIGKSIATVRKMEGVSLHPNPDAKGVHWFDEEEVEAVVEHIAFTGRALEGVTWPCARGAYESGGHRRHSRAASKVNSAGIATTRRAEELEAELRQLRTNHAAWKQRLDRACARLLEAVTAIDDDGWEAVEQIEELLSESASSA